MARRNKKKLRTGLARNQRETLPMESRQSPASKYISAALDAGRDRKLRGVFDGRVKAGNLSRV